MSQEAQSPPWKRKYEDDLLRNLKRIMGSFARQLSSSNRGKFGSQTLNIRYYFNGMKLQKCIYNQSCKSQELRLTGLCKVLYLINQSFFFWVFKLDKNLSFCIYIKENLILLWNLFQTVKTIV